MFNKETFNDKTFNNEKALFLKVISFSKDIKKLYEEYLYPKKDIYQLIFNFQNKYTKINEYYKENWSKPYIQDDSIKYHKRFTIYNGHDNSISQVIPDKEEHLFQTAMEITNSDLNFIQMLLNEDYNFIKKLEL